MAGVGFDHFLIKLPSECTAWTIVYPHNNFLAYYLIFVIILTLDALKLMIYFSQSIVSV